MKITLLASISILFTIPALLAQTPNFPEKYPPWETVEPQSQIKSVIPKKITISKDVRVGNYFSYIDSLVSRYDSLVPYPLTEHLLAWANPWIIDTLANTDYYRMKARDSFVYDQKKMVVLPKGNQLMLPDSITACRIQNDLNHSWVDVNIPEFKLRIYRDSVMLHAFPVRVGQNKKRYLAFGDRITDLRTKTGRGKIVGYVKNPDYYNPVDGKRYYVTRRDDERTTLLPQIPFLDTEIDGIRYGQLIHPTTNPETLGKAYSNGCIGTKESDAWIIYYNAPLGTPIHIRYDLNVKDEYGQEQRIKDIYGQR
ncbi:MAG: murein L,D-transpeptidase [Flavobacteriales bacterium]|nr:MAG: murein L,D-transpeptidase [Flavobacteriales bacterium]